MEFKYRIRDLRREKNITADELGEIVGVSRFSVSNWETGRNQPNNDILIKLAEYFNVSVDYLLGITDIPHTDVQLDEFQVALYNGTEELTDEQKEDLLQYVDYLKSKKKK